MQTSNKKRFSFAMLFALLAMLSFSMVGCNDDDNSGAVILESFGPSPVDLGGQVTFIGQNLDKVSSIDFPSGYTVTDFVEKSSGKLVVKATSDTAQAYEGLVVLHTASGDITTKTKIGYSQTAVISAITGAAKPGQELTITGSYLSSVLKVVLPGGVEIPAEEFVSQQNGSIVVIVPEEAKSGKVQIFNGVKYIFSEQELSVNLPAGSFEAKIYKSGVDELTINGTDLDLVSAINFDGASIIADNFKSKSATSIVLAIPASVKAGVVNMEVASGEQVSAGELTIKSPVVSGVVNADGDFTYLGHKVVINGTDLDLVKSIKLGGVDVAAADAKISETSIEITLAADVKSGAELALANGEVVKTDVAVKPCNVDGAYWSIANADGSPAQIPVLDADGNQEKDENGDLKLSANYVAGVKATITNCVNLKGHVTGAKFGTTSVEEFTVVDDNTVSFVVPCQLRGANQQLYFETSNGEDIQIWNVNIKNGVLPFISMMPKSVQAGSAFLAEGANLTEVFLVKLGDISCTFSVVNDEQIFINTPAAGLNGKYNVELVYANGSTVSASQIKVEVGGPIAVWSGDPVALGWDESKGGIFFKGFDMSEMKSGYYLKFTVKQLSNDPAWSYINFRFDKWGENAKWTQLDFSQGESGSTYIVCIELTDDLIKEIQGHELYCYGESNLGITKVSIEPSFDDAKEKMATWK